MTCANNLRDYDVYKQQIFQSGRPIVTLEDIIVALLVF